MIYDGIITKPPMESIIVHFNPNHDPSNGQFTTGNGGSLRAAVQKLRRKGKRYQKDLEEYKTNVWRKTYNKLDQANTTKWAKEEKDTKEKKALTEYAKWYKEDADRNQKYLDKFDKKYGEHRLEDVFSKKELKEIKAQTKYADDILNKKK